MQICHKYREHHLQYMIIEFNNILQMRKRLRSNPNVASAEGVPKEPTEAKRRAVSKKPNGTLVKCDSKNPTEARAKGALKEPTEAKRKRLRRIQMKRSKYDYFKR